ncbi:hypothetical protein [Brevifollis gellanilyticus]|uniref:DUF2383 domain-containing protein n=1 Tax=Brevifollis gellanilyticus TaxID=748831 RepID=A0A512M8K4_9BACT|nr:hypothetical protein [Brevifollis gellanilyticus]GEP43080.1 hypothetical protein BGE01nite_23710 [Brevifollis gellanilyticus]
MNHKNLITYLTDHLAGSVAALELLDSLISSASGDIEQLTTLRDQIRNDQSTLKQLNERLGGDESGLKNAGAWSVEKLLLGKLKAGNAALGRLEALEVLALGIEGKLRLWRSLHVVDVGLNLPELETAALRQIELVEAMRIKVAREALADE